MPAVVYVGYVLHYSVQGLWQDDFGLTGLLDDFHRGRVSFSPLWAQFNEQRMPFPNIVFGLSAAVDHFDTRVLLLVSAGLLTTGWVCVLAAHKRGVGAPPATLLTLLLGACWFSLADCESALFTIQLSWYLVIAALGVMLLGLSDWRRSNTAIAVAGAAAFVGSFSAIQGLALWPVGALCLAWRWRHGDERVPAHLVLEWSLAGIACVVAYVKGLDTGRLGGTGSLAYVFHHPADGLLYFLMLLGNAFPTIGPDIGLHQLVGAAVALAVVFLVVTDLRTGTDRAYPLPTALVAFALLFDASAAVARVSLGLSQALSSRYTMANLLLVVAAGLAVCTPGRASWRAGSDRRTAGHLLLGSLVVVLAAQVATATTSGIHETRYLRQLRVVCNDVTLRPASVPPAQLARYVELYCDPRLGQYERAIGLLSLDHLGQFAK